MLPIEPEKEFTMPNCFYIQGKPEEVITINPRAAYRSRHGWFLLAAGICYGMYLSFLVMLLVVIQIELALKE